MDKNTEKTYIMATRLKKLREEGGYSHDRLSAVLSEKYGVKISSDSLMNYEVSDQHHSKAGKNQGMRVEYLRILSDFYGVSTDYIIGLSDVATNNPNMKDSIAFTGLSEDTVKRLYAWNNLEESMRNVTEDSPAYIKEIAEELSWVNNQASFRESLIEFSNILLGSYLKHPRMITRWYQWYLHSLYTWYSTLKSTDEHDIFLKADEVDDSICKYGLVTITAEDAAQNTISKIIHCIADYLEFEAKSIILKELDLKMPDDEIPLR